MYLHFIVHLYLSRCFTETSGLSQQWQAKTPTEQEETLSRDRPIQSGLLLLMVSIMCLSVPHKLEGSAESFSLLKASFTHHCGLLRSQALDSGGIYDCNRCDINKVELNFTFSSHLHMLDRGLHLRTLV